MRVVFMGNDRWSVPSLKLLSREMDVALVVTRGPRPAGRGSQPRPTAVSSAASDLSLHVLEVDRIGDADGISNLRSESPDAIAVVAYGEILSRDVLDVATCVNLHFSLLPRWRGAAPVQRAIMAGDRTSGVTTIQMEEGLDTGPILMSEEVAIEDGEDAGSLGARLADVGAELLVRTLLDLSHISPQPQSGEPTSAPKLTKADRVLDLSGPAVAEAWRVRALSPEPGASTRFRGKGLNVFAAEALDAGARAGRAGEVIEVREDGFVVACGTGALSIRSLGSEGRSRLQAVEWLRGARLRVGELLG